jgi:hypothetical protein
MIRWMELINLAQDKKQRQTLVDMLKSCETLNTWEKCGLSRRTRVCGIVSVLEMSYEEWQNKTGDSNWKWRESSMYIYCFLERNPCFKVWDSHSPKMPYCVAWVTGYLRVRCALSENLTEGRFLVCSIRSSSWRFCFSCAVKIEYSNFTIMIQWSVSLSI